MRVEKCWTGLMLRCVMNWSRPPTCRFIASNSNSCGFCSGACPVVILPLGASRSLSLDNNSIQTMACKALAGVSARIGRDAGLALLHGLRLRRFFLWRNEADRALPDGFRRHHQFAEGVKDLFQLNAGALLERVVFQGHQFG